MPQIQINIGDHTSSMAAHGYVAFPAHRRPAIRWARRKAFWIAANKPAANPAFSALPGGRSLSQLLADNTIWVNYHATMPYWGETEFVGGKEIAISVMAHRVSEWSVLATLLHELAHSNGAPGSPSNQAESVLVPCGLGSASERGPAGDDPHTPFDPNIIGSLRRQAAGQRDSYA